MGKTRGGRRMRVGREVGSGCSCRVSLLADGVMRRDICGGVGGRKRVKLTNFPVLFFFIPYSSNFQSFLTIPHRRHHSTSCFIPSCSSSRSLPHPCWTHRCTILLSRLPSPHLTNILTILSSHCSLLNLPYHLHFKPHPAHRTPPDAASSTSLPKKPRKSKASCRASFEQKQSLGFPLLMYKVFSKPGEGIDVPFRLCTTFLSFLFLFV